MRSMSAPRSAAALPLPALIICGTDDATTPPKYSEYLAAHLPQSSLAWVGDAGHRAPLEQPRAWNAAVLAWAERHVRVRNEE